MMHGTINIKKGKNYVEVGSFLSFRKVVFEAKVSYVQLVMGKVTTELQKSISNVEKVLIIFW